MPPRRRLVPPWKRLSPLLALVTLFLLPFPGRSATEPCRIEIVEKGSGWPVCLVELRTTHGMRFFSDNAGVIAVDQPELLGREVWFDVIGNGYEVAKDGFGFRGMRLTPKAGTTLKIEVTRSIIAKRLGRLTGAGQFAESQKTGQDLDWKESDVFGCDSVQNAVHGGKMFWAWGDTTLAAYPLGIFDMTSATSSIRPLLSSEPTLKLRFEHFRDSKGALRGVAKMPGTGPTWVDAYVSLPDKDGKEHLVGSYIKVRNHLDAYESGLCVWNDEKQNFEQLKVLWTKSDATPKPSAAPTGHPAFWQDDHGKRWVLFGNPFPVLRCPATFESWQDSSTWEPLKPPPSLVSAADGKSVKPHSGSIAWNAFRQRWVTVFMENGGKPSGFGELWYAESKQPEGPWGKAIKILTHENYTFYNPRLHPEFTPDGSPTLLFEGTYTAEFANRPPITPRFNYNQILYRLDLNDAALAPAYVP